MRVLVLGAAAPVGAAAVRTAASFPFVLRITAADLNLEGARQAAAEAGQKARCAYADLRDAGALVDLMGDHDVVLNAAGPFYELGPRVLESAIHCGINYADICDDWEPTLEMLQLAPLAKQRGVTALVGLGASPGITNLLAVLAADALDQVDELLTGWSIDAAAAGEDAAARRSAGASAAIVHWVQQLTGTIRIVSNGRAMDVKPLDRQDIPYPGFGEMAVWSVGHPESVTLPRKYGGLVECRNVMIGDAAAFDGLRLLMELVDSGVLDVQGAAEEIARDPGNGEGATAGPDGPSLFAWAKGRKNGRSAISAAYVRSAPPGGMAGASGVPLALSLQLFRGGLEAGVFPPEDIVEPRLFLDAFARRCEPPIPGWKELVVHACTYAA